MREIADLECLVNRRIIIVQVCASGDVAEADDAMDQRDTSEERGQEAEVDVQTETHPATKDAESDCEGNSSGLP